MKYQDTIIRQLLNHVKRDEFQQIVDKYKGDRYAKSFKCWDQFVSIFYAQLRQRDCIREIETGLEAQANKLYHLGISPIKRSTFSDANKRIDYRIYEEVYEKLLQKFSHIIRRNIKINSPIVSLDSSTIHLCHEIYPWSKFQTQKGGVKLHVVLNHNDYLPDCVRVTDRVASDLTEGRRLSFKPDSILLFDRGYMDYKWFYSLHKQRITFVSRLKKNSSYDVIGQLNASGSHQDILLDEKVMIPGKTSTRSRTFMEPVRVVTVSCPDTGKVIKLITNNFSFSAEVISQLYRQRWQVEIFFKWIKQTLLVKTFFGISRNAVYSQLYIALILYLLLRFIHHQVNPKFTMTKLTRLFNELAFERLPILEALTPSKHIHRIPLSNQLLFGFS